MRTISLLLRDDWGALQRVLQTLTKKRVRVETVLYGRCEQPGQNRVFIASADEKLPRMVEHLRKLGDVAEAECLEGGPRGYALVRVVEERVPLPMSMDLDTAKAIAEGAAKEEEERR